MPSLSKQYPTDNEPTATPLSHPDVIPSTVPPIHSNALQFPHTDLVYTAPTTAPTNAPPQLPSVTSTIPHDSVDHVSYAPTCSQSDPSIPPTELSNTTIIRVSPTKRKKPKQPANSLSHATHPSNEPTSPLIVRINTSNGKRQRGCPPSIQPQRYICRHHDPVHTVAEIPHSTNRFYHQRLLVHDAYELPGAGKGLYTTEPLLPGQIIGIYENHTDGKRVTKDRVRDPHNTSLYAVECNGLVRDAWNPRTGTIYGMLPYMNDPLDASLDNVTFGTNAEDPTKLLGVVTRPITLNAVDQEAPLYTPYGGYYWCDDRHPVAVLIKVIHRYGIDIHTSNDSTDGDWRALHCYSQLCATFPKPSSEPTSCPCPLPPGPPTNTNDLIIQGNALSRLRRQTNVTPAANKKRNRPKSSTIPDIRQRTISGYIQCRQSTPAVSARSPQDVCNAVSRKRAAASDDKYDANGPNAGGRSETGTETSSSMSEPELPDSIAVCASKPHVHAMLSAIHDNDIPAENFLSSVAHFSSSSSSPILFPATINTSDTPMSSVDPHSIIAVSVDMPQQSIDLSCSLLEYDKGVVFK